VTNEPVKKNGPTVNFKKVRFHSLELDPTLKILENSKRWFLDFFVLTMLRFKWFKHLQTKAGTETRGRCSSILLAMPIGRPQWGRRGEGRDHKISLLVPALDLFSRNSSASLLPRGDHEERKRPSVRVAGENRIFSFLLTWTSLYPRPVPDARHALRIAPFVNTIERNPPRDNDVQPFVYSFCGTSRHKFLWRP